MEIPAEQLCSARDNDSRGGHSSLPGFMDDRELFAS